jgi:3-hydroxy-9,10-secoandrosta-1,3,5(10)-triene-9,17-dione monooxygenase
MLGMFPPPAQDEIWGKSRDALIASSFVFPAGKARKVQDGYLLSGRWPFSSGVGPSEWNMLAGLSRLDDNAPPEQRVFLLERSQYKVLDTWFAGGLRGTGSNDVEVKEQFVPEHRTLAVADTKGGPTPGSAVNPSAALPDSGVRVSSLLLVRRAAGHRRRADRPIFHRRPGR